MRVRTRGGRGGETPQRQGSVAAHQRCVGDGGGEGGLGHLASGGARGRGGGAHHGLREQWRGQAAVREGSDNEDVGGLVGSERGGGEILGGGTARRVDVNKR